MKTRVSAHSWARRIGAVVGTWALAVTAHAQFGDTSAEAYDQFGYALASGDFNGDGYQDVAVGLPFEDIGSEPSAIFNAGAAEVIYGTASGLASSNRQFWRQGTSSVGDTAEASDFFGVPAVGDFNADGFDDLAVGVSLEDIGNIQDAGAVHVLYGSASGLSATAIPDQLWHQDSPNVDGTAEPQDCFGRSPTTGDFNGDGYDDLAVAALGEDIGGIQDAGAVHVLYGSASGLSATVVPDQLWHQDVANVEGVAGSGDFFGDSLAAGDFNGDGRDDLAIGVPMEWVGSNPAAGAVNVLYGSSAGLSATAVPDQLWHQDVANVEDVAEAWDVLGEGVATGDFNGDGRDDLAISVTWETVGSVSKAGAVNVLYGSAAGLSATTTADQFWHQDMASVEDAAEANDHFGAPLVSGDFNGDGRDDLAVAVMSESIGSTPAAGAVNVLYGSSAGLSATAVPDQLWHQNVANVEGGAKASDHFGASLAAGDFNGDGRDDLAVGVPDEDVGNVKPTIQDAGAMNVIYGWSSGLDAAAVPDQLWTQVYF